MTMPACDRLWEVDALREGRLSDSDAESVARHRRACSECRTRFEEDERLLMLGRALAVPVVDELHAKRLRAKILRDAAGETRARTSAWARTGLAIAAVAAVFAIVVWNVARAPSVQVAVASLAFGSPPTAKVTPRAGAVFGQERHGQLETVRLAEGAITLSVPHRDAGERFIVVVPDGEIEVRGTTFTVEVVQGRTERVRVVEGVVALRIDARDEIVLRAEEEWTRAPAAVAVTSLPLAAAQRPALGAPAALASPSARTDTEGARATDASAYGEAMKIYRANRYDEAARAFHAFAADHPRSPEAEDAAFLEAASLARAGRGDAAAVVAERFLERYGRSFHARDAAMLVARAARDRGDCDKARRFVARFGTASPEWKSTLGTCAEP